MANNDPLKPKWTDHGHRQGSRATAQDRMPPAVKNAVDRDLIAVAQRTTPGSNYPGTNPTNEPRSVRHIYILHNLKALGISQSAFVNYAKRAQAPIKAAQQRGHLMHALRTTTNPTARTLIAMKLAAMGAQPYDGMTEKQTRDLRRLIERN